MFLVCRGLWRSCRTRCRLLLLFLIASFSISSAPATADTNGLAAFHTLKHALEQRGISLRHDDLQYDGPSDMLTVTGVSIGWTSALSVLPSNEAAADELLRHATVLAAPLLSIHALREESGVFFAANWEVTQAATLELDLQMPGPFQLMLTSNIQDMRVTDSKLDLSSKAPDLLDTLAGGFLRKKEAVGRNQIRELGFRSATSRFELRSLGTERMAPIVSGVSHLDAFMLSGFADGRIDAISVKRSTETLMFGKSGAGDLVESKTTRGRTVVENVRFDTLLDFVLDPAVPPFKTPTSVIGSLASEDITWSAMGTSADLLNLSIEAIGLENIGLNKRDDSPLSLLRLIEGDEPNIEQAILDIVRSTRSLSLDQLRLTGLTLERPMLDPEDHVTFALQSALGTGLNSDGIEAFKISGYSSSSASKQSDLEIETATISRLEFADLASIEYFVPDLVADPNVIRERNLEFAALFLPRGLELQISGLTSRTDKHRIYHLPDLSFQASSVVPPLPTDLELAVRWDAPAAFYENWGLAPVLNHLDRNRLLTTVRTKFRWNDTTNDLHLDHFTVTLGDILEFGGSMRLTHVPRDIFEHPRKTIKNLVFYASFDELELFVQNAGNLASAIAAQAELESLNDAQFHAHLVAKMTKLTAFLKDEATDAELKKQLRTFLRTPGTLKLTAAPNDPVKIAEIVKSYGIPGRIPELLNLKITAH